MSAAHVLVLYTSAHGHTGKIADRVATVRRGQGIEVRDRQLGSTTEHLDLSAFDGVVAGASVHVGRHQHEIVDWITETRRARRSASHEDTDHTDWDAASASRRTSPRRCGKPAGTVRRSADDGRRLAADTGGVP